jgi:hypothetical protein
VSRRRFQNPYLALLSRIPKQPDAFVRLGFGGIPQLIPGPLFHALPAAIQAQLRAREWDQPDGGMVFVDRNAQCHRFAWAIPNTRVVRAIAAWSPLIEVGAGNGYWAWLLRQAGADVVATDLYPWMETWTDVVASNAYRAAERHPDRTLFLCWPPYKEPMAEEALAGYRGGRVVYVGERGGCTGTQALEEQLAEGWRLVKTVRLVNWEGIHDCARFYLRESSS